MAERLHWSDTLTLLRADDCKSMTDVREQIDAIDAVLVDLFAVRQTYLGAAGRLKGDRSLVRDPARIEDVVLKVMARARDKGLDPAIAEGVWRELIERSIDHEYGRWDAAHGGQGPD